MKKCKSGLLLVTFLFLGVAGCVSMSIGHEYDPQYDFSKLHTYSWIKDPDQEPELELVMKRLRPIIDKNLKDRGFRQSDNPEFRVAAHIQSKNKVDLADWGYGHGWRGSYGYGFEAYQYEEGSLLVDIVDVKTNELVWQGLARTELKHTDPELRDRTARRVINRLFNHFPPQGN